MFIPLKMDLGDFRVTLCDKFFQICGMIMVRMDSKILTDIDCL